MASEASAQTVRPQHRALLARILAGLTLVGFAIGLVYTFLAASIRPPGAGDPLGDIAFVLSFAMFPVIGYVLAIRRAENSIGWLMLGIGTFFGLTALVISVGEYLFYSGDPGTGRLLIAFDSPSWVPIVVLPVTFLLLLFPDGHLPSPRWRWFAWSLGVGLVVIYLSILLDPAPMTESIAPTEPNPLGIEALRPFLNATQAVILVIPIGVIASLTALILRFRRSSGVERLQLRWLLTAAVFVALLYAGAMIASIPYSWGGEGQPGWVTVLQNVVIPSFVLIPLAIGVSILRYRLFDIDLVINRALLFGALAVFITVVYVAIVVGVGALVGSQASPVLSAGAAAVVALAFQPARKRAQRFADRLVYGKRATPYEVLSAFSERVGNAYANDELLPRMARALASGTGAVRTDVWVRVGDELRSEATWPEDAPSIGAVPVSSSDARSSPTSVFEPVRHQGELLGALSIEKKPGDAIAATEEKLVRDLAAQAGLVMRNVALTEQLIDHIEQLRRSQKRLVSAQDEERRRLERNLHDGAQQQLVALAVKLRLAEQVAERDPAKVKELLAGLQSDAGDALENLRDLARGIYPPLLADKGLVAALGSQARKSTIAIAIEADGVGRYPQEAEAAVYFSCLEALQNVAKYASASQATISLSDGDGRLRFAVKDDGVGFDQGETSQGTGLQGIADRLAALDGAVEITSVPGGGTTVSGSVPVARVDS
ncbi:MAG TPA: histidine kinase [Actinomycetota bacterium]|nr:histidine kinase [Actinomycetota bacterium]